MPLHVCFEGASLGDIDAQMTAFAPVAAPKAAPAAPAKAAAPAKGPSLLHSHLKPTAAMRKKHLAAPAKAAAPAGCPKGKDCVILA
eukprot:gene13176-47438_t